MNGGNELIKLLVLRVTNDCNLRCRYCYARGGDNRDRMSLDVARQAIDYAAARSKSFKIQFTGGEPLLEFPLIKKIIDYANSRCSSAVVYQLQTNGTLITPGIARELKYLGVAVGVSLDGMPKTNDWLRPAAHGGGSALAVLQGLHNLKSAGIKVGLTAVLTADNVAGLPQLVELASYLGNIYGIALDLLRPLGRAAQNNVLPPAPELLAGQVRAALSRAEELSGMGGSQVRFREVERLKYQLHRGIARKHYCYATTGQSMAVTPRGEVYPCSSLADVTGFCQGNIADRDFSLARALSRTPSLKGAAHGPARCRECPDRWLCGGGCLARAYAYTGGVDAVYSGDCLLKQVFLRYVREKEQAVARTEVKMT
ncbi:MAG: radical SAM protein [Peptococcaceae bacterium]|jgi:uncharacterized protein|nr:radical SAM protein [Peptococcaceae bacterium]MDH7524945.1 radical SAM protein [Peptococcaceae bacterium]